MPPRHILSRHIGAALRYVTRYCWLRYVAAITLPPAPARHDGYARYATLLKNTRHAPRDIDDTLAPPPAPRARQLR